jgi:hypothetical protein
MRKLLFSYSLYSHPEIWKFQGVTVRQTRSVDPHPCHEGGGGDAPPSPGSLLQSCLEGGGSDARPCGDDAKAIRLDG